ncbi:hypothetical protein ACSSV8_003215 [Roseovarius sp. MBR-79]|jgi:hypothetical protein
MLTILFTLVDLVFLAAVFKVAGGRSIIFLSALLQAMFYMPILFLVNLSNDLELKFLVIHQAFFLTFLSFCLLFKVLYHCKPFSAPIMIPEPRHRMSWSVFIFFVSIIITILYYVAQGGLIYSKIAFTDDIAGARLSYYATLDGGAGYVNQFKNILMPVTAAVIFLNLDKRFRIIFAVTTFPVLVLLMTGTGQRFPLAFAFLFFAFAYTILKGVSVSSRVIVRLALVLFIFIAIFGFLSDLQGRSDAGYTKAFSHILERVLLLNQTGNLLTFNYLDTRGFVWGSDWIQDIIGISPFAKPSSIGNELFSVLWGSLRGNSAPSLATSVYYNFYIPGLIVVPAAMAYSLVFIAKKIEGKCAMPSKFLALVFMGMTMGGWVSGGILSPLNTGLITMIIFMINVRFVLRRHNRAFG